MYDRSMEHDGPIDGFYVPRAQRKQPALAGERREHAREVFMRECRERGCEPGPIMQDGLAWTMEAHGAYTELLFVCDRAMAGVVDVNLIEAHLKKFALPIAADPIAWSVMFTWEALRFASVVVDESTLRTMWNVKGRGSRSITSAALEAWRAPHFAGDELVFFANERKDFCEVRVHRVHHYIERAPICESYRVPMQRVRGRALLDGGRALRPPFDAADPWAARAADEAAAVLAFSRAHDELEVVGAPRALLARYKAAMRDEARHARICKKRASTTLGKFTVRPATRAMTKKDVALAALFESAIPESLAVAEMARADLDDQMRGVLDDERAHVELAWDTIAWAAEDPEVAEAVWRAAPAVLDVRKRAQALL